MPSSIDTYIKTLYEIHELSPDEIAEDQNLDVIAVKAKLMQVSSKYRKACSTEPEYQDRLNFSDEQLEEMDNIILDVARNAARVDGSPDYKVRLEAATYVRDDKKGRKEAKKQVAGMSFNLLAINEQIQKANISSRSLIENAIEVKQLANG